MNNLSLILFFKKYLLKIQNPTWFFIGVILLILGTFIVVFDYPQIQYFDNMDTELYATLESEQKEIHNRLKIEFAIGGAIILGGITFCIFAISNIRFSKN